MYIVGTNYVYELYEKFEDTKVIIRIVFRRREDNTMAKRKRTKEQTTFYKTYTYS